MENSQLPGQTEVCFYIEIQITESRLPLLRLMNTFALALIIQS